MKEKINVFDYAELIDKAIHPGVLLNTNGDKFNSMVIGWGHLGVIWGINTFVVYVRQSRYTKAQIDKTMEFTISVPMGETKYPKIFEVCGTMSGRDVDKADYVTLEEPATNHTPGIKEYPLTIECEVIYKQDQDLDAIAPEVRNRHYGNDPTDFHTCYIGRIVDAYIIK
ncbi:MAG: flavin reductase [Erysipelotrichaceae bacterium]|nr:flavin reductase [Erysipelotrichaceae bacterium]